MNRYNMNQYRMSQHKRNRRAQPQFFAWLILVTLALVLSGCSLLFGSRNGEEPTPNAEDRVIVPTFTPTPELPPTAPPEPTPEQPAVVEVVPTGAETAPDAAPDTGAEAPAGVDAESAPTATVEVPSPTPIPKVVVSGAAVNARSGPGTDYGLVGAVTQGQSFDVTGKNPEGTWWQFCCVNGQQAWIFGELVTVENSAAVPVAQNIPAAPVAAAPPAATPVPAAPAEPAQPVEEPAAPPENTPEPAPPSPAGAVNAGGCGGDDGCKFRMTGGPSFSPNGGGEMKLSLFFMHSGVDGGQPQGDYRLGVERDGQLISVFADTTSRALDKSTGSMGPYNYEAKIGAGDLPGGNLEGTYLIWVLDGNRERDSDVYELHVPAGQGDIWIQFDQG